MKNRLLILIGTLFLLSFSSKATLFTVNNNAADNLTGAGTSGTLRYCITQANLTAGPHRIIFSLSGVTITLASALPVINQSGIRIDGTAQNITINNNYQNAFINAAGINGFRVTGLRFNNPGNPTPIQLVGATANDTIDNNTFTLPTYVTAISISGTCSNIFINSNIVTQTGDFVNASAATINGFTSTNNTNNGVAAGTIYNNFAYVFGTLSNFTISNNVMLRNGGGGTAALEIATASNGTIANNRFNFFNNGVRITATASNVLCNFNQIIRGAAASGNYGLYFPAGTTNTLTNNVVQYFQTGGVFVSGTSHIISGNRITNCEFGLRLSAASNCVALTDTILNFNNSFGIMITSSSFSNVIGGLGVGRCIITNGNSDGIRIDGGNANQIINVLLAANTNGSGVHIMNNARLNSIKSCLIGVNATGIVASPNSVHGIFIETAGANNNTIGGTSVSDRNIISGNGQNGIMIDNSGPDSTKVLNNYIGVGSNGTTVLVNGTGTGHHGIRMNSGSPGSVRNVIKNNVIVTPSRGSGISIEASSNDTISYNYIGVDATGVTLVGIGNTTGEHGITIKGSANNEYICNNVISGSRGCGIKLDGGTFSNCIMNANYIGTDVTGLVNLGNGSSIACHGMHFNSAGFTTLTMLNNVVAGSTGYGIFLDGGVTSNFTFRGNMIGMNKNGLGTTFGNAITGALFRPAAGSTNLIIGGINVADRNIISKNGSGTAFACATPDGCGLTLENFNGVTIKGNYVGVDATGLVAAGNGNTGIMMNGGNSNMLIGGLLAGEGNIVCSNGFNCTPGNDRHGIQFVNANTAPLLVQGNLVGVGVDGVTLLGNSSEGVGSWQTAAITIGGATVAHRNIISGNGIGIHLQNGGTATGNHIIQNNYIGTDVTGTIAKPNFTGIRIANYGTNTIGGAGVGNIVSGNTTGGILLENSSSNTIQQNLIGVDATLASMPNQNGIRLSSNGGSGNSSNNLIGSPTTTSLGNTIAYNTVNGVFVFDAVSIRNNIRRNSIYCNGTARVNGINLNSLGNTNISNPGPMVVPTYITAPTLGIQVANTPAGDIASTDVVEVFFDNACGTCQGKTYLGNATNSGTQWSFSPLPAASDCTPKGTGACLSGVKNITATRTDNVGNTSEFMDCDPVVLPVELISFTANKYSSDDVIIKWTTASEKNNAYFELLRSTDGKTFVPITKIQGYGNSSVLNDYTFIDENSSRGINYYMLVQVDFDGKQTLSQIISVNASDVATISILPTGLASGEAIKVVNFTGKAILSVSMLDMNGKLIIEHTGYDSNEYYVSTSALATGVYLVKVATTSEAIVQKVVVY